MTKLCPRGKAAAKRKFSVYPSAYANAYASKICAGKIKDPSGKKRKDFKGPKPSGAKVGMAVTAGSRSGMGRLEKSGLLKARVGKSISRRAREMQLKKKQNPYSEYNRKGKLKYTAANKGAEIKINKVVKGLKKASKLHAGQAKTLQTIKAKEGVLMENPYRFYDREKNSKNRGVTRQNSRGKIKGSRPRVDLSPKDNRPRIKKKVNYDNTFKEGGMARGGGAAIRGTKFQGVF